MSQALCSHRLYPWETDRHIQLIKFRQLLQRGKLYFLTCLHSCRAQKASKGYTAAGIDENWMECHNKTCFCKATPLGLQELKKIKKIKVHSTKIHMNRRTQQAAVALLRKKTNIKTKQKNSLWQDSHEFSERDAFFPFPEILKFQFWIALRYWNTEYSALYCSDPVNISHRK